ncbi:MAG: hypothetical protein DMF03_09355 [Verrucomicrobia bacterium]|nr:MAG: hypothetical protein DMF03_09355 [Verrucomicrobiota bacterium]
MFARCQDHAAIRSLIKSHCGDPWRLQELEFLNGIARLQKEADAAATAVMCAEAVWWRCHRSLIADYLKANGINVIHILDARTTQAHPFTSAAKLVNGKLSYSAPQNPLPI